MSMSSVRRDRSIRLAAMAVMMVAAVVTAALLVALSSDQSSAALWPKNVRGYILDHTGAPVEGANVTVEMWSGVTIRQTLYEDSTASDGFYTVAFQGAYWDENNTIKVTARLGEFSATNSTLASSAAFQYVNVTLWTVIPEFGALLGSPLTFVSIGLVAIVIISFRVRKRNPLAPV